MVSRVPTGTRLEFTDLGADDSHPQIAVLEPLDLSSGSRAHAPTIQMDGFAFALED
jgi:hypothetical protein